MRRIPSPMVLLLALAACGAEEAAPPTSRVDCQQSRDHAGDELAVPESRERAALPHPVPPTPSSELDAWLVREYAVAALGHVMPTAEVLAAIAGAQADAHAQVRIAAGRAWARQQGQGPAPR